MGNCKSQGENEEKLVKVLGTYSELVPPDIFKILADILKSYKMFPDSLIFPEKHPEPITVQPNSRVNIEDTGHDANVALLAKHKYASNSEEEVKYLKQHIKAIENERDDLTNRLHADINEKIKRISELESQQRNYTEVWPREEETRQQSSLQQSVNRVKRAPTVNEETRLVSTKEFEKSKKTIGNNDGQQQSTRQDYNKWTGDPAVLQGGKQPDYEKLKKELDKLKRDNVALQEEIQQNYEKLNKEVILRKEKQQDCEKLKRQLTELEEEKQRDHKRLKREVTLQEEKQRDYEKLKMEMAALQEEKQLDHEKLAGELAVAHDTRQRDQNKPLTELDKQRDHEKLTRELEELQQEKRRDREKLTRDLTASQEEKMSMQKRLNGQITDLEQQLADMSSKIKELLDHQETKQSELDELGDEKEKMSGSMELFQRKITSLKTDLDEKEKELNECCNDNSKLSTNLEHLHSQYQSMQEELRSQIGKLQEDNSIKASSIGELLAEKEQLVQQLDNRDKALKDAETRIGMLSTSTTSLEREKHDLHQTKRDQMGKLTEEKNKMTSSNIELRKDRERLEKQLGTSEDELKTVRLNKDQLTRELETVRQEYHTTCTDLEGQVVSLNGDNTELSSTAEKLQRNVGVLETQLSSVQATETRLNREKAVLEKEIASLRDEKQELHRDMCTKLEDIGATNTVLASNIYVLQQEKETLQEKFGSLEAALRTVNMEKGTLETEIASLRDEKQELHRDMCTKLEDIGATNKMLASNIDVLQQEKETLQEKFDAKDDELQTILREMREAEERAKRKSVVLSLRSERSGMGKSMVDMLTKEITRRLEGKVDRTCMDLTIQPHQASAGAPLCGPLVVLCLNMSRVGTNIQDTLKGIKVDKDVISLVLHHTSKENLSSLTPTSLRVTGTELRQLGGIIDMAFSSDSGLYECDLNNTAMEKLAIILKKY